MVQVDEVGDTSVIVFKQGRNYGIISTRFPHSLQNTKTKPKPLSSEDGKCFFLSFFQHGYSLRSASLGSAIKIILNIFECRRVVFKNHFKNVLRTKMKA